MIVKKLVWSLLLFWTQFLNWILSSLFPVQPLPLLTCSLFDCFVLFCFANGSYILSPNSSFILYLRLFLSDHSLVIGCSLYVLLSVNTPKSSIPLCSNPISHPQTQFSTSPIGESKHMYHQHDVVTWSYQTNFFLSSNFFPIAMTLEISISVAVVIKRKKSKESNLWLNSKTHTKQLFPLLAFMCFY